MQHRIGSMFLRGRKVPIVRRGQTNAKRTSFSLRPRFCSPGLICSMRDTTLWSNWISLRKLKELCIMFDRADSIFTMTPIKNHIEYFNFRSKIQLDHPVLRYIQVRCPQLRIWRLICSSLSVGRSTVAIMVCNSNFRVFKISSINPIVRSRHQKVFLGLWDTRGQGMIRVNFSANSRSHVALLNKCISVQISHVYVWIPNRQISVG